VRVVDQDPAFLRYLTECGLDLGTEGELAENRSEARALVIHVGGRVIALGHEAAAKVLVATV
jgi:DtxR family Mn-dependent transcriptional regulator